MPAEAVRQYLCCLPGGVAIELPFISDSVPGLDDLDIAEVEIVEMWTHNNRVAWRELFALKPDQPHRQRVAWVPLHQDPHAWPTVSQLEAAPLESAADLPVAELRDQE